MHAPCAAVKAIISCLCSKVLLSRHSFICAESSGKIVGSSGSSTYVSNGPGRVQSINVGNVGSSAYSSSGACPTI